MGGTGQSIRLLAGADVIVAQGTEGGGHVGFFEGGPPWNPDFWMEEQSASFLAHHHHGTSATIGEGPKGPAAENVTRLE